MDVVGGGFVPVVSVVLVVSVAVGGRLLFLDGGFGFVPIVSIAEVAVVDVVEGLSLFVAGSFFGIGAFGISAGAGAFAGAAVDGAAVVVGAVVDVVEPFVVPAGGGTAGIVVGAVVVVGSIVATVAVVALDSVTVVDVFVVSVCLQAARKMRRTIAFFMSTPWRSIAR